MKITPIVANTFLSDGGVMFGLVPKPIWSRFCPADDKNRIPQAANVLLVELDDGRRGLIDSGCGDQSAYPEKAIAINGLGSGWPLMERLNERGIAPTDIDFVLLTHLHWDHASGVALPDGSPAFPHAELIVPQIEWEDAHSGNPLFYKAYPQETIAPLSRYSNIRCMPPGEVFPGVELIHTGGHTRGHGAVRLTGSIIIDHPDAPASVEQVLFSADVLPTSHHLRMVFHPAYDLLPLETRAWKQSWLPRCAADHTWIFFCHDPVIAAAQITPDAKAEFVCTHSLPIR